MMQVNMIPGNWCMVFGINAADRVADGVHCDAMAQAVQASFANLGFVPGETPTRRNPVEVEKRGIALHNRQSVTCAAWMTLPVGHAGVNSDELCRIVAASFKSSGGGSNLSVSRLAFGLAHDRNLSDTLLTEPDIASCASTFQLYSAGHVPTYGSTSFFGEGLARAGTGPVSASSNPVRVGTEEHGELLSRLTGGILGFWGSIPVPAQVGIAVVGVTAVAVGGAYVYRAVK